jgi:hypothetical protein
MKVEPDDELNDAQIQRQDFVDNTIFEMLQQLIDPDLAWDIDDIEMVCDAIQQVAVMHGWTEQDFYPYLETEIETEETQCTN